MLGEEAMDLVCDVMPNQEYINSTTLDNRIFFMLYKVEDACFIK